MGTPSVEKNSRVNRVFKLCTKSRLLQTVVGVGLCFAFLSACSSSFLKFDKQDELQKNDEFAKMVTIIPSEEVKEDKPPPPTKAPVPEAPPAPPISKKEKKKKKSAEPKAVAEKRRLPHSESNVGFAPGARRPLASPFRVGEKVVHSLRYFKVSAGTLTLETRPYKFVNGRKSYNFVTSLKSSPTFSTFYTADDWAETMVDYETMLPSIFSLHVKESGQLREANAFFDQVNKKAKFWQKKVTKKKGMEEINKEYELPEYAQNVFSAAYYMRLFKYEIGKEYVFSVGDYEQNVDFRGKALRKEVLETEAGVFNTIVVQPTFELKGVFKPVGNIFFWLTDDDRKFIVRIESEIKIGTIVSEAISIEKGEDKLD